LSFDAKNDNKTVTTKVQSQKKKTIPKGGININGDHFTVAEARRIWAEAGKPPERTSYVTAHNNMTIKSSSQPCLWQNVFTAVVLADQARSPNLLAPAFGATKEVHWDGLVAYYWWAMISKFQQQEVGVLQNDVSAPLTPFHTTVVPQFPVKNRLPTGVLKFIETFLPSTDKDTGATVIYKYIWNGFPTFSIGGHLAIAKGIGDFGYCPYGNFYCLNQPANTGDEITFRKGVDAPLTIDQVFENSELYDAYVTMTTAQGTYADLPDFCSMATVQARVMVSLTDRKIVSSSQNIDAELACIFFGNYQGVGLASPYRYERPVPIVDTGITNQFSGVVNTEFYAMTLNYGYIMGTATYFRGGLQHTLSSNKTYDKLKTLQPKFFNLDLAQYHRHLDDAWIMISKGSFPADEFYTALVVWESCIMSRMMYCAYMGLPLYSLDNTGNAEIIDMASTTYVSGVFRTASMPPAVAFVLGQLGEIVTDGQLMVPLWNIVSPRAPERYVGIGGGSGNAGLPVGISQWSGRWVGISSLSFVGPVDTPNGNLNTYSTSTAGPPVVYQPNVGPFQFSGAITVPQTFIVGGLAIGNAAIGTNLTIATPAYPPMTPVRLATLFLEEYSNEFNQINSNFVVTEDVENADHCEFNAVVRNITQDDFPLVGDFSQTKRIPHVVSRSKVAATVTRKVKVHPVEVGSYIMMDGPQATKTLTTCFRVVPDLAFMPFKLMNKQDGDITLQMNMHSLASGSPTVYLGDYQAAKSRGEKTSMAIENAFSSFTNEYYEHGSVGPAVPHKVAVLGILKSMHGIVVGPYRQHDTAPLTSVQSWSDISKFFTSAWSFTKHYVLPVAKVAGPVILGFL